MSKVRTLLAGTALAGALAAGMAAAPAAMASTPTAALPPRPPLSRPRARPSTSSARTTPDSAAVRLWTPLLLQGVLHKDGSGRYWFYGDLVDRDRDRQYSYVWFKWHDRSGFHAKVFKTRGDQHFDKFGGFRKTTASRLRHPGLRGHQQLRRLRPLGRRLLGRATAFGECRSIFPGGKA